MTRQVQALWDLCEWQLDDPARFRALLKSEEEATSWYAGCTATGMLQLMNVEGRAYRMG